MQIFPLMKFRKLLTLIFVREEVVFFMSCAGLGAGRSSHPTQKVIKENNNVGCENDRIICKGYAHG
jgi:hypothetical protein